MEGKRRRKKTFPLIAVNQTQRNTDNDNNNDNDNQQKEKLLKRKSIVNQ